MSELLLDNNFLTLVDIHTLGWFVNLDTRYCIVAIIGVVSIIGCYILIPAVTGTSDNTDCKELAASDGNER